MTRFLLWVLDALATYLRRRQGDRVISRIERYMSVYHCRIDTPYYLSTEKAWKHHVGESTRNMVEAVYLTWFMRLVDELDLDPVIAVRYVELVAIAFGKSVEETESVWTIRTRRGH